MIDLGIRIETTDSIRQIALNTRQWERVGSPSHERGCLARIGGPLRIGTKTLPPPF